MLSTVDKVFSGGFHGPAAAVSLYDCTAPAKVLSQAPEMIVDAQRPYWPTPVCLPQVEKGATGRRMWLIAEGTTSQDIVSVLRPIYSPRVPLPIVKRYVIEYLPVTDAVFLASNFEKKLYAVATSLQLSSPLVAQVKSSLATWSSCSPGSDESVTATAARDDAVRLLDQYRLPGEAMVEINDDGILSIEWHRKGCGVLLVFSGDNTASYSRRDASGFYSSHMIEFSVGHGLPDGAQAMIQGLTS